MKQLTKTKFLEGYEKGYITDVIAVGSKIYGKDPRGQAKTKLFEVVWCNI